MHTQPQSPAPSTAMSDRWYCQVCLETGFPTVFSMVKHVMHVHLEDAVHTEQKPGQPVPVKEEDWEWKCDFCLMLLATEEEMKRHIKAAHEDKSSSSSNSNSNSRPEQEEEAAEKVHKCPVCLRKAFKTRQGLDKHVQKLHQQLLEAQPDSCHVATEVGALKSCPLCANTVFKTPKGLEKHLSTFHLTFLYSQEDNNEMVEGVEGAEESKKEQESPESLEEAEEESRAVEGTMEPDDGLQMDATAQKELLHNAENAPRVSQEEASEPLKPSEEPQTEDDNKQGNAGERLLCLECPKRSFKSRTGLSIHIASKHKGKPSGQKLTCKDIQAAPESMDTEDNAQDTSEEPKSCSKCPELSFKSSAELKKHLAVHQPSSSTPGVEYKKTESGFQCSLCLHRTYVTKQSIRRHIKIMHGSVVAGEGRKEFPCQSCRKSFDKKLKLDLHMKRVHKERNVK